jgi:hypothetical protein
MIYAKIYEFEDKTKDDEILFFGDERLVKTLEEEVKTAKEGGVNKPLYSNLSWLANNDFTPISETFFYKE